MNTLLTKITVTAATGAALVLGAVSSASAATLEQTRTFSNTFEATDLFQQFNPSLGTLQSVVLDYNTAVQITGTCTAAPCSVDIGAGLEFTFPGVSGLNFGASAFDSFPVGPFTQSAIIAGTYAFTSLSEFIGTGAIGSFDSGFGIATVGAANTDDNLTSNFKLTYTYDDSTAIPTPALLPGLIGMGVAALRKKRKAEAAEPVES